ncbi:MAG: MotA/TolQ/ExbB proton channel family protein [Wenzhouxiangellaceae bacterium]
MLQGVFDDLLFYMEAGGYVMPPLVVATFVLWFALGYRYAVLRRGTPRGARNLLERMVRGISPKKQGVMVRAARKGLALRERELPYLRRFLDDAFADEEREIRRFNILITTIVMVAPLLGLLGTVVGMIETFDSLGDMSLFSQSGGIAGGISQALFTTQMGLAVAIPGLIVNGILSRRARDLEMELAQLKDILCSNQTLVTE